MQISRSTYLLLGLLGCNRVFSLEETHQSDAAFFDAPPPSCPPFGGIPAFTKQIEQVVFQPCTNFSIAANGRVLASCLGVMHEGMLGAPLVPAPGFTGRVPTTMVSPRIHPDGNSAAVVVVGPPPQRVAIYVRDDAGWSKQREFSLPFSVNSVSAPSRNGHMIVYVTGGFYEILDDGTVLREITLADLGVTGIADPISLGADGLRLVVPAVVPDMNILQLFYADRASVDDPFSKARRMTTIDYAPNGFLTADCGRLYISTLGTVFYSDEITTP